MNTLQALIRRSLRDGTLRWDLGIHNLLPQWKALFLKEHLKEDLRSGAATAALSFPFSLAIALACEVDPDRGLITAIVSGVFFAFFGGSSLGISAPSAIMAIVLASSRERFGIEGLLWIGLGCGVLQLVSGVIGLGRIKNFVPKPVVLGFLAGMGTLVFLSQLPRALGLPSPDQAHLLYVATHLFEYFSQMQIEVGALSALTIALSFLLKRFFPRTLLFVLVILIPTLLATLLAWDVPRMDGLWLHIGQPELPPTEGIEWAGVFENTFLIFVLSSFETLFSSPLESNRGESRSDSNQELIGQGLGNVAAAIMGGIPAARVVARSQIQVEAGGRTRRSALFCALALVGFAFLLSPVLHLIPEAVFAGILISAALVMMDPLGFSKMWRTSRTDATLFLLTYGCIVLFDLFAGIQMGILMALAFVVIRLGRARTWVHRTSESSIRVTISGPLSFLFSNRAEALSDSLIREENAKAVIFELSGVSGMDSTGGSLLLGMTRKLEDHGVRLAIKGLTHRDQRLLEELDDSGKISEYFVLTEADIAELTEGDRPADARSRLAYGVTRFRKELRTRYRAMMQKQAAQQKPHTLFITCADSRISPNLFTSTDPGELFVVRNVGNVVVPNGASGHEHFGTAIEYALSVLKIRNIVVCGHSGCGAIAAVLSDQTFAQLPTLAKWIEQFRAEHATKEWKLSINDASRKNVLLQIEALKSYPIVSEMIEQEGLTIAGWYCDLASADFSEWNPSHHKFVPIGVIELS